VLLRPEEIHGASGVGNVLGPPPEGYRHISHQALGFGP
jgi:hypothetical protein